MAITTSNSIHFFFIISFVLLATTANSDIASDQAECTKPLVGLATCLPYVQGTSKAPTPDCCSGLKQVLVDNKKCLCVLIRDRNDPQLGIKLNATLALALPDQCKAQANISHCPALLNMDPNSKEAAIFEQGGSGAAAAAAPAESGSTASSTSSGKSSSTASTASKDSSTATSSMLSYESCFLAKLVVGFGISILVPLLVSS